MLRLLKKIFGSENDQLTGILKKGAYLVDVRSADEFRAGSVKGAVNIPLDQLPAHLNKLKEKKSIVVFCRSGGRSTQAKHFLQRNGIMQVTNGGSLSNMRQVVSE